MDIVRVWIQGYLERKNSLYKKNIAVLHLDQDIGALMVMSHISCWILWNLRRLESLGMEIVCCQR